MLDTESSESKLKMFNDIFGAVKLFYLTRRLSFSPIRDQNWFENFAAVYFLYQLTHKLTGLSDENELGSLFSIQQRCAVLTFTTRWRHSVFTLRCC